MQVSKNLLISQKFNVLRLAKSSLHSSQVLLENARRGEDRKEMLASMPVKDQVIFTKFEIFFSALKFVILGS